MSCGHNGAVVLVVKCCTAKVHHTYSGILHRPLFSLLSGRNIITKSVWTEISHHLWHLNITYLLYIVRHRKVWIDKEDVLRLEVCVCQFIVVENYEKKNNLDENCLDDQNCWNSSCFLTEENIGNIQEMCKFLLAFLPSLCLHKDHTRL